MSKLRIDISKAKELEKMRVEDNLSWRELYARHVGIDVSEANPLEVDALRKHVERKKNRPQYEEVVGNAIGEAKISLNDMSIAYKLVDDEISEASGSIDLQEDEVENGEVFKDPKAVSKLIFDKFHLDPAEYELVGFKPTYSSGNKRFKIQASFKRRIPSFYDEPYVVERYTKILEGIGKVTLPHNVEVDRDNIMVINLADVHWNKMPHKGFDSTYLERFEQMIYDELYQILDRVKYLPISRVALTLGHDFFQTNDGRGTTKKGTPVSHIMEYKDMFDMGVRILGNCIAIVGQHYIVDAYYVLANHDEDASWHATRELKIAFRDSKGINIIVDKDPCHYIEWGSTLIELVHENLNGGRSASKMHVIASEAWGRTKYRYSIGGHLHGEYMIKEGSGVVTMGSRALSDSDNWHVLQGYVANLRGLQAYIFNKDSGLISTQYANL